MKIWIVVVGEPLPIDEDGARLHRKGQLAKILIDGGHEVIFWSSTTNHMLKTKRAKETTQIDFAENHQIILLDAPTYSKNISPQRIWHNYKTAKEFLKVAETQEKPDVIVCSYPPIELADAVCQFGKKHHIPTILDARDLWPDIFVGALPSILQPFGKLAIYPLGRKAKRAFKNATAITGITDSFVDWALDKAKLSKIPELHPSFYLSYSEELPSDIEIQAGNVFWDNLGLKSKNEQFIACMMGNLGFTAEIDILIKAVKKIPEDKRNEFRIVICGTGMAFNHLKELSKNVPQVILPGWMNKGQIITLLQRSTVGTLPYLSDRSFQISIPNKVGEYLSAGLPILSSVQGEVSKLLNHEKCGITYPNLGENELADLFVELRANSEKIQKMSTNAKRVFKEKFNAKIVYKNYASFIETLVKNYSN